jgi:nicotinate-nucleotide pyrophosphorylase (carboxylating)
MSFSSAEAAACLRLVQLALDEDLGSAGDLTSQAVIPADLQGSAVFVARAPGVVAGMPAAALVAGAVDARLLFQAQVEDGSEVTSGTSLATIAGPMRAILATERTALNFLQRLSGVATVTRQYVKAVAGLKAQILDTRKTTPGWRLLEKYAVRCGGGHNHRMGLYDGILIKDNHLAAIKGLGYCEPNETHPISHAVKAALRSVGGSVPVEIEVDNVDQFADALACDPEIILLDNMSLDELRAAVELRDEEYEYPKYDWVALEASGGVNLATVRAIAETGVDRISVGALTHSAPALDIALDYLA